MCIDLCIDMCIGICIDMRLGSYSDIHNYIGHSHIGHNYIMCLGSCTDIRTAVRVDTCTPVCRYVHEHAHGLCSGIWYMDMGTQVLAVA